MAKERSNANRKIAEEQSARAKRNKMDDTLNYYSEEMTKQVVGRLFEQYASDDGKNYFADRVKEDDVLYSAEEESAAAIEEDDNKEEYNTIKLYTPRRVRAKRTDSAAKRNKSKKKLKEELERNEEIDDMEEELDIDVSDEVEQEETETVKKSGIFSKIGSLGKNADIDDEEDDEYDDIEIDEEDYDDEDDYEDRVIEISKSKAILIGVIILLMILSIVLAVRGSSYKSKLADAETQIAELEKATTSSTYETELNELKAKVEELTNENTQLKASGAGTAGEEVLANAENNVAENEQDDNTQQVTTYTVKQGDTFWSISAGVYGNGANYQKILDANGMTENSPLSVGQELKIPN